MSLTESQRNLVVFTYYVMMIDLLVTIAGVTTLGINEGNPIFSWIKSLPLMFTIMFLVNIIYISSLIGFLNHFNNYQKTELIEMNVDSLFTSPLSVIIFLRFLFGPVLWLVAMCVV